ncbi:Hypothetical predicted protein, partial [Marmota monax]
LDPSKDPCLKVKCSPHKVCVTQDYQTALCVSRKHLLPRQKKGNVAHKHWVGPSNLVKCKPCPVAQSAMVCGSDGHTYTSKCKLEFHACSTSKSLTSLCDGPCPCLPEPEPPKHKAEKNGEWGSWGTPCRGYGQSGQAGAVQLVPATRNLSFNRAVGAQAGEMG